MTAVTIERLDRAGFDRLGPAWDALVSSSPAGGPFLTSAWLGAWLATLGRRADLELLVARAVADGALVGAAPFHVESRSKAGVRFRVLRLLGSGPAAPDHLDLPVAPHAPAGTAATLWEAVQRRRRWDLVDLDGVIAGGVLSRLLARRRDDAGRLEPIPVPFLHLAPTWEATAEHFDGAVRGGLGRQRRRLEREVGVATERMVVTADDLEDTLGSLERLHQAVRRAAGQRGAFTTPESSAFQREVARRMLGAGRLRLWRLDVNGEMAAAIECFRHGDTVAFYLTGYDLRLQRYAPGTRVMAVAVAAAIEEGATGFDFLRGDEPYKRAWGAEERFDLRIVHPASRRGRALLAARALTRRRSAA